MSDALRLPPFNLSTDDLAWVVRTRDSLSTEDQVRQLFLLAHFEDSVEPLPEVMAVQPGGVYRTWGADLARGWATTRAILERSPVPPLIAGDMEGGGYLPRCATPLPNAMGMAAMNQPALSRATGEVLARETAAMGVNWSFTPVLDIAYRLDSAIVGTRSYGSNPETILREALTHVEVMRAAGVATTAKHWPGEGFDARDQHLVTTTNPLGWDAWHQHYGPLYRGLLDSGVMSVMAGHIAWPAGVRRFRPDAGRDAFRPATVSPELLNDLLRGELGFNGLIVSDATGMAGLTSWGNRRTVVPLVIESGCDMFLFSRDPVTDYALMLQGLREGRLSEKRLHDAVTRVLGLKAALGLHKRSIDERLPPLEQVRERLATPAHQQLARKAAQASITLVKDVNQLLPLSPVRHKRVVIISAGIETLWHGAASGPLQTLMDELTARGFELRAYEPDKPPTPADTDVVLYLLAKETMMTRSHIFIDWTLLHGDHLKGMRRFWHDLPTVMVSFGHPAYLMDAPRVPVYINAYSAGAPVQQAVAAALVGEEPFTGVSPIDAFCGLEDAHW